MGTGSGTPVAAARSVPGAPAGPLWGLILKALGVWVLLLVIAVLIGMVRETYLESLVGPAAALPLGGVLVAVAIFAVTLAALRVLGVSTAGRAWLVGGLWLALTVAFEFLFGHFVLGQSWARLLAAYDPGHGNLWLLVVFTTLCAPFLAGKTRGIF